MSTPAADSILEPSVKTAVNAEPHVAVRKSVVSRPAPLLPVAIGLISGIQIDASLQWPIWWTLLPAAIGFALTTERAKALLIRLADGIRVPSILVVRQRLVISVLLVATAAGMARHAVADRWFAENDIARYAPVDPQIVTLTGRVISAPRIIESPPGAVRAFETSPRTQCILAVDSIEGQESQIAVSGHVSLLVKEPVVGLCTGHRIRVTGWLHRHQPPQNPGGYNWALHNHRNGISAGLWTDHAAAVRIVNRGGANLTERFISWLRRRAGLYLTHETFGDGDESSGVVSAMVLGQRSDVSKSLNEAFTRTGNIHFLAASGMNVAWLALVGWALTYILGLRYRAASAFIAVLIILFVLVAEPEPPILRAGIVGVLACVTTFYRGRLSHLNALAFAAIVLLVFDPFDWFRPGFRLTFLATLGLLHFFPLTANAIADFFVAIDRPEAARLFRVNLFGMPNPEADREAVPSSVPTTVTLQDRMRQFGFLVLNMATLAFTLAATEWILTTPLACYHFNTLAPWGAIGTFLVAPFAMLVAWTGFARILLGIVFPSIGYLLGLALSFFARLMTDFVALLAQLPGTMLDGRSPSSLWLLCVYGLAFLWGYGPATWRRRYGIRWYAGAAFILFVWWFAGPMLRHWPDGSLRVWMLAVGNGTATVIEFPDGQTWLYDFGSRSSAGVAQTGIDFLRHRGISQIHTAIVSHPDFDHYGAILPIAKEVPIRRILINDQFEPLVEVDSPAAEFLRTARSMNIQVDTISGATEMRPCEGVAMEVLWPPAHVQQRAPGDNDASMVLRLSYQGHSVLLTGDIAEWSLGQLSAPAREADGGSLHADALALPHHGSVVANTTAFIEAVNPLVAVRSTAERRALTINGIELVVGPDRRYFSTADDGCIVITIKDGVLRAERAMQRD